MAIFNRYQRLTEDPNGIDPPPYDDGPDQYLPQPNYGPLTDPNVGLTGGTGPAAQIPQQDPQPSGQQHAMDDAGKLPPVAGGPPMPPPGLQGAPTPGAGPMPAPPPQGPPAPPPGLAGAPAPPPTMSELAEAAARKYATMAPPAPPKNNLLQSIAGGVLGVSRLAPQAQAILHPKYAQQLGQYGQQKQDLAEQVKLADQAATVGSQETSREAIGDAKVQNSIANMAKIGIVLYPKGTPPPDGLIPTINPMAGQKNPFGTAVAYHDPHVGQFRIDGKLAQAANLPPGWYPKETLDKAIELGKPVKSEMVGVSPATAKTLHIETPAGPDGAVQVPISILKELVTAEQKPDKEVKEPNANSDLLSMRATGVKTGNSNVDAMTPQQAAKALETKKERPPVINVNAGNRALDSEIKQYGGKHEKTFTDANTQLEKINDAQQMVKGGAIDQALGIPKVMTALISGAGSGVRITQAELSAIANARGIGGNIEGTIRSWLGQGKLTPQQQNALNGILEDVKQRVLQKREIANNAYNAISGAGSRDQILAADKAARDQIMALETPKQAETDPKLKAYADTYFGGDIAKAQAAIAQQKAGKR